MAGAQAGDGQGDLLVGQRVDLAEQADVEGARQGSVDVLDLEAESLGGRQQPPCCIEELAAFLREREAGAAPMAEAKPQPGLQRGQLRTDGRLGGVERSLRGRDSARLDDGEKDPDQADIQLGYVPQHAASDGSLHR
ncbi:hypothetical protein D3C76_1541960 [compost metagenome]